MIKKNTKIIFEGEDGANDELIGGVPLTKGEIVHVVKSGKSIDYEVTDKQIDFIFEEGDNQIANITYTLRKKN